MAKWGQKYWGTFYWGGLAEEELVNKYHSDVFRRAMIKRRLITDGTYESTWFDITDYVEKWGTIKNSIDAVKLNDFKFSGITLVLRNDEGKFNPETFIHSFFHGYMTRFRTLLKIEAGYLDEDGNEVPADSIQGIFILTNDIKIDAVKNQAICNFKSIASVFEEVPAVDIPGLGATGTASQIITRIKNYTDGSGHYVFQQFISAGAWYIQSTTTYYNPATSTSLAGLSTWDLLNKLAEAEGFIVLINRSGGFEFRDRTEKTTASQFSFRGLGFDKQNVIGLLEYKEPINTFYNYFRLKFKKEDTSTSYVTAGTTTTVNPSLTSWKYGVRKYEFENTFIPDTATAQNIVDARRAQFDTMKEEIRITTKFVPSLDISDKVEFSYRSYELAGRTLWDFFNWDEANWASEEGDIFDWKDVPFKIISKSTNLDTFVTSLVLRRL